MGMFLNYQNIADNYKPNNLVCSFPVGKSYTKLDPVKASKPYEEYNSKGELVGYFWRYGEILNLEFNIDGEITVESDALVFTTTGLIPSNNVGKLYQKAYNTADQRSWICTSILDGVRTWTEEAQFTYAESSSRSVYINAADYLKDKFIKVTLFNFRFEPIHQEVLKANTKVIFNITKELSEKLVRGVYYCSLNVFNDTVSLPLFDCKDCVLLVK